MKAILTISTLGVLAGTTVQADTNNEQIQEVISKYEFALNASNTERVLELYGKSPIFMPQHAPAQVGREAVKAAYDRVFNTIKLNVKFTTHEMEVDGDTAWVRTSTDGETRILANDAMVHEGNNELFVFKNENGSWKIHRYLFSTNQPRQ